MTKDEVIEQMLSVGYLLEVDDGYVITNKIVRELTSSKPLREAVSKMESVTELPSPDILLKKLIKEAEIPDRSENGSFIITTRSEISRRKLYDYVINRTYLWEDIVQGVKKY